MPPKLYMVNVSPPVRSVLLTAEALGVALEQLFVNLAKGDNFKPDYLKINPQHTIPTLEDDGKVLWDSHAINIYLVTKYGKDDSLYPSEPYKRALINQRLHFDSGVLFSSALRILNPIVRGQSKTVSKYEADFVVEAYEFLEKFLDGQKWASGDSVTLADLSLIPSVTSISFLVPMPEKDFPNIHTWIKRAEDLPYYDANRVGSCPLVVGKPSFCLIMKRRSGTEMAPKLYKMDLSPPVRSVYLTAKALGVDLEYIEVNLIEKDHLKPDFVKLNPQHTVPTLDDNGTIIWDSHAINAYLVAKYGKDDSLYPKDPIKRAMVDQRLHFDSGVLAAVLKAIVRPMIYKGVKTIPNNLIEEANTAYDFLDKFVQGPKWLAGDDLTIADFSAIVSITCLEHLVPVNASKYPNVVAWIKRVQELPYYNVNQKGLDECKAFYDKLLA